MPWRLARCCTLAEPLACTSWITLGPFARRCRLAVIAEESKSGAGTATSHEFDAENLHRDDAFRRFATTRGAIERPVETTDAMMPGVVSIPHGWGHHRAGTRIRIAERVPGVSVNDILDPEHIDELSSTSVLNGQAVTVETR